MIKKITFLAIVLFFIFKPTFSQPQIDWEKKYNGSASFIDEAHDFAIDENNNIYTAGNTFVRGRNKYDAILIKYDNNGNILWETTYPQGTLNHRATNITIINDFIYLTCIYSTKLILLKFDTNGNFISDKILKSGDSYHYLETISYNNFIYIKTSYNENYSTEKFELIKCDLSANIIWTYNYNPNACVLDMNIDNEGNIILAGSKNYILNPRTELFEGDALLLKISNEGNLIWDAEINILPASAELEIIEAIDVDNENNIYSIVNHSFVSKINKDGELEWNNQFNHQEYTSNTLSNIKINNQNLYLNGYSWKIGIIPNILTICYNLNGNMEWYDNYFTEYSSGRPISLNFDNSGNIYSFGYSHDVGGRHDIYFTSYTPNGQNLFEYNYNSTGNNSEKLRKAIISENKIYLLASSNQDIMTLKLNNPFVTVNPLEKEKIRIYPNPTNDIVNFKFIDNNIYNLTISDITGKTIIQETKIQKNKTINLSDFSNGIYIIKLQTNNKTLTSKLIKK